MARSFRGLFSGVFSNRLAYVLLALLFTFCMPAQKASAQYDDDYISYNDFYENLAPYGIWIEDPKYGYVWSPNEDDNFRPYYTNGYWAMTDYGNTWISDYPWGWAAFHYGRWTYDNYYGWLWIPGTNWGPSWVSWRYGDGFYGWAPLGPNYEFSNAYGDYSCPTDWWVFIPPQYVYSGNYYRYWYGPHSNTRIISNTVFVNNTYTNNNVTYVSGPRTREIEDLTHQPVQVYKITNSTNLNTRVKRDVIKMYRPTQIRQTATINGSRTTPPNVVRAPQSVRAPQAVNTGQATPPQFRSRLPEHQTRTETPGTNFNQTAQPARPPARNDNNPYEWDVNRPVKQPEPRQAPAPGPAPAPAPQQQSQQQRPAPAPAQQQRPAPTPAPQQRKEGGSGRR